MSQQLNIVTVPSELSNRDASWNYGHQYTYTVSCGDKNTGAWSGKVFADPDVSPKKFRFVNPIAKMVEIYDKSREIYVQVPGVCYDTIYDAGDFPGSIDKTLEMTCDQIFDSSEWEAINEPDRVGWVKK